VAILRKTAAILIVLSLALSVYGQDSQEIIETYQRNFVRSSLGTKLELLMEAAGNEGVDMGPLYETAIRFVLGNAELLKSDPVLRDIAIVSAEMIKKYKYTPAAESLWDIFQEFQENTVRVSILAALGEVAKDNPRLIERLNTYLAAQNTLFRSGTQPDYPTLEACIQALGALGDGSSFPVLFSAYVAGYKADITKKASDALASLKGDYLSYLIQVVERNTALEKRAAMEAGLANASFSGDQRASLAEAALRAGLSYSGASAVETDAMKDMRYRAARELTERKWQRASPLVVKHFYDVLSLYNRSQAPKGSLLEAIACLGAMGTPEAAQTLSLYLQLINTETEQGKVYDEQIVMAVIRNLGILGDKVAFDYLLYIGYLKYPDSIKKAAKDALQSLKW
jgi:HEAT repeat protein